MKRIVPPEWVCRNCDKLKASSEFSKHHTICKACYSPTPEHRRVKNLRRYNLTLDQYNEMFHAQGGVCACCGQEETLFDARNNSPAYLRVDHDHKTGKVRGLLCHNCNTALGLLHEDRHRVLALLDYLIGICE